MNVELISANVSDIGPRGVNDICVGERHVEEQKQGEC